MSRLYSSRKFTDFSRPRSRHRGAEYPLQVGLAAELLSRRHLQKLWVSGPGPRGLGCHLLRALHSCCWDLGLVGRRPPPILPSLLCFTVSRVYCQEAGAAVSRCLCQRDSSAPRLPVRGRGVQGSRSEPAGSGGLRVPEAVPSGFPRPWNPGFAAHPALRPGLGSGSHQQGPSTLARPSYPSTGTLSG